MRSSVQKTRTSSGRSKRCLAAAYLSKKKKKAGEFYLFITVFMIHEKGRQQVYTLCRIKRSIILRRADCTTKIAY